MVVGSERDRIRECSFDSNNVAVDKQHPNLPVILLYEVGRQRAWQDSQSSHCPVTGILTQGQGVLTIRNIAGEFTE